jgi:hypothetical protein
VAKFLVTHGKKDVPGTFAVDQLIIFRGCRALRRMQRTERGFHRRLCKDGKRVQQEQDVSQRDMFHGLLRHAAFEALGVSKTADVRFAQLEHAAVTCDRCASDVCAYTRLSQRTHGGRV